MTRSTGKVVVDTFLRASSTYVLPAATLTDNGRACTARFGGGRNAFEYLLAALGITQKNGQPFHPRPRARDQAIAKALGTFVREVQNVAEKQADEPENA